MMMNSSANNNAAMYQQQQMHMNMMMNGGHNVNGSMGGGANCDPATQQAAMAAAMLTAQQQQQQLANATYAAAMYQQQQQYGAGSTGAAAASTSGAGAACSYCYTCSAPLPAGGSWYFCSGSCEQRYNGLAHTSIADTTATSTTATATSTTAADAKQHHSLAPLTHQNSVASMNSSACFTPEAVTPDAAAFASVPAPQREAKEGMCLSCVNRNVAKGTKFCSKRCSWLGATKCPQCGRGREATQVFCSNVCVTQASQANWCTVCGVRQIAPGSTHCSAECASQATAPASRRRTSNSFSRHQVLPPEDKTFQAIAAQYAHAVTVTGVIKLHSDAQRRKKFLNYRSFVEQSIQATGFGKYGHGGEGNEQRRLFPLSYGCSCVESGLAAPCGSTPHTCSLCSVLQHGFTMQQLNSGSHFCVSNAEALTQWCAPNAFGSKAFVVGRVVLGVPQPVSNHSDVAFPSQGYHSTLVDHNSKQNDSRSSSTSASNSNTNSNNNNANAANINNSNGGSNNTTAQERFVNDDVCVFRDDAVDPQYLVTFF